MIEDNEYDADRIAFYEEDDWYDDEEEDDWYECACSICFCNADVEEHMVCASCMSGAHQG